MIRNTAFQWQVPIPRILLDGARFDKWSEGTQQPEKECIFKVDDDGFFLCCTPRDKSTVLLEISEISDVRAGAVQKWSKRGKPTGNERSFTIFTGRNLVDIRYLQLSADDPLFCQQWTAGLRQIIRNVKAKFISPMTMLRKRWKHLVLAVDKRGRMPVHQFTALFGSGISEDSIRRRLKKLQLLDKSSSNRSYCPLAMGLRQSVKCVRIPDDTVDPAELPFDKFFDLYLLMCPRPDLKRIFDQLNDPDHGSFLDLFLRFLNKEQRDPRISREEIPYYTEARLKQLIQMYEPDIQHRKRNLLSFSGFCHYMMSDENAPIFLDRLDLHQNMGHPLNHYFINSSHNTYLIGKQIHGISSVDMYRQVLFTGCRCIELDIWDGDGDTQEPVITHAHEVLDTFCTKILFKDALVAIRETAFQTSEMPVILSFENHCSLVQQEKMAEYCEEILGDLLLKAPLEQHPLLPSKPLPSPSILARRILIKNKRLPAEQEKRELDSTRRNQKANPPPRDNRTKARSLVPRDEEPITKVSLRPFYSDPNVSVRNGLREAISTALSLSDHSPKDPSRGYHHLVSAGSQATISGYQRPDSILEEAPSLDDGVKPGPTVVVKQKTDRREYSTVMTADASSVHRTTSLDLEAFLIADTSSMSSMVEDEGSAEEAAALAAFKPTKSTSVIHASLSALVNYTQAIAFPGFADAEAKKFSHHMSSFDAQAAIGLLRSGACDMLEYNKRQLSRIYPAFPRGIFSKNFLPHIFWSTGCQMIALNFQTPDIPMQVNSALFEFNGNCGFLLKPELMRRPDRSFDPFSQAAVDGLVAACCTIEVISGHFLCERRTGTYVEVEMYGLPTDTIRDEYRTPTVLGNGLDPVYDAPKFVFRKIVFPELATIRFCVYDEDDRVLAQRVLPFQHLQAGFRHIPLRSEANCPLPLATLFCRISMDTYVVPVGTSLVDSLLDPWKKPHANPIRTENRLPVRRAFAGAIHTSSPEQSEPADGEYHCGRHGFTSVMVVKKQKSFTALQQKQEAEKATLLASHVFQRDHLRASHEAAKDGSILKKPRTTNSTMDYMFETLSWAQSMEWSEAIYLQLRQAQKLAASHCAEQCSLLTDLLKSVQQEQLKFTHSKHKREFERLECRQVETSMTSQKTIKKDKTISKQEKLRQLSEMRSLNARKFSEERESLKLHQRKERGRMDFTHKEQMFAVDAEREKLISEYKAEFLEAWNPPREETRC